MKRLKNNSDAPEARHGTLPTTQTSSKKTTRLHSTRPRKNGYEDIKKSDELMTANGEVQTREEATVYVKELDLFVTVMFLDETPAVLSLGRSARIMGFLTTGPAVKNHISPKGARKLTAKYQTMCHL